MQSIATITAIRPGELASAIAEFLKSGNDLGDHPTPDEQNRLSAAFDALARWRAPAASFQEAIAALRLASDEFRVGQEADGLARPMLEAAMAFLDTAGGSVRPLPVKRRWARRPMLSIAA